MEMAPVVEWLHERGYFAVGATGTTGTDAGLLIRPKDDPMEPPLMVCEDDILTVVERHEGDGVFIPRVEISRE